MVSAMEILETEPLNAESGPSKKSSNDSIHMKKELGLLEGVAIIVGIIIGSGLQLKRSFDFKSIKAKLFKFDFQVSLYRQKE